MDDLVSNEVARPNKALQLTANPLRGRSAAEHGRFGCVLVSGNRSHAEDQQLALGIALVLVDLERAYGRFDAPRSAPDVEAPVEARARAIGLVLEARRRGNHGRVYP